MSRIRTFIAIDLPKQARGRAGTTIEKLARISSAVRWVAEENLHITLKFLGDVEDRGVYDICKRVKDVASRSQVFSIQCRGIGAFPKIDRPRTVWLGIDDSSGQLEHVFQEIENQMAELGIPREPRKFHPHLTIGRLRKGKRAEEELAKEINHRRETQIGEIPVAELIVFASELTSDGPVYTAMARAPLNELS